MRRVALVAAVLVLLATGAFLALREQKAYVPVYRFADTAWRARIQTNAPVHFIPLDRSLDDARTDAFPTVSILDETQYVLTMAPHAPLLYTEKVRVREDGRVLVSPPLPADLNGAERVALEPQVKQGGIWTRLPSIVARIETTAQGAVVPFELTLPAGAANSYVGIHVEATAISPNRVVHHRTPEVQVPAGAYLDLALGIQRAAWEQGAVEFRVRACAGESCELILKDVVDPRQDAGRGWQTRRIPLDTPAHRAVAFVFESELVDNAPGAFSLPAWGNPTVYAPGPRPHSGVNVILLSIDTLAAKHLPTYGYGFDTAPFIDELAREGTVFERCVAAATTTPQSHMSMLTGVQPCIHGITTGLEKLSQNLVTLGEVLRAANYETGAVTEDGWLGYQHGFGRGFNSYAENKSADIMAPEGQIDVTLRKARTWLERNRDKTFFLFLHSFQVHDPYSPPAPYQSLFRERDGVQVSDASSRALRENVAYDQEIRYTDDELRKFFGFLRESGLSDNTVFILTSDHGEAFFEHGVWGHGPNFFDEVSHVPLIIWGPGRVPAQRRIDATVGHIDLMATILGLTGVGSPRQSSGVDVLAPLPHNIRFSEAHVTVGVGAGYEPFTVMPPGFMVQRGAEKMSRYSRPDGFDYEYYDLRTDPTEQRDLFGQASPGETQLKPMLDAYQIDCNLTAASLQANRGAEVTLDPASEEKLRALGYLK